MATLTLQLPDEIHQRLTALAQHRRISLTMLLDQLSAQALAQVDHEIRFRAFAAQGDRQRGLDLLDQLDAHFGNGTVDGRERMGFVNVP